MADTTIGSFIGASLDFTVKSGASPSPGPISPPKSVFASAAANDGNAKVDVTGSVNARIWGNDSNNHIDSGSGDDVINAGGGDDRITAGAGDDRVWGDNGEDEIWGGSGNDQLHGGNDADEIHGGANSDLIWGDGGDDFLFGDEGNDTLNGGSGDDVMEGGDGKDTFEYWVNNKDKSLNFGASFGNDTITDFESGKDKIDMRTVFARMSDADVKALMDAIDNLVNEKGKTLKDQYDGILNVPGTVKYYVSGDEVTATENLDFTASNGDHLLFSVTALQASSNGKPTGNPQVNLVMQNLSNEEDTGASILFQNVRSLSSKDFLREDAKVYHGTDNDDDLNFASGALHDALDGKGVIAYGFGKYNTITGTEASDKLFGGDDGNTLNGGDGSDSLWGGNGADKLNGDGGNDKLYGGDGADELDGGAGVDQLYAGNGNDTMTGGADRDTFVLGGRVTKDGAFILDTGTKTITDFNAWAEGDKIVFSDYITSWTVDQTTKKNAFAHEFIDAHFRVSGKDLIITDDGNIDAKADHNYFITVAGALDEKNAGGDARGLGLADTSGDGKVSNDELHTYLHDHWADYFQF